jgi:hypothetical protein
MISKVNIKLTINFFIIINRKNFLIKMLRRILFTIVNVYILCFLIFTPWMELKTSSENSIMIEGDWIINDTVWMFNEIIIVGGSVIILDGGKLFLRNSTLFIGVSEAALVPKNLTVKTNGLLSVVDSTITSNYRGRYWIYAEEQSAVEILYSKICNAGRAPVSSPMYLFIRPPYTNDRSKFGHGIELETPVWIKETTFVNVSSIRFYASGNIVENNTIINLRHEGFAFMESSTNNIVKYNRILNASVDWGNPLGQNFDKETFGIRFYPPENINLSDQYDEVYGNFIQNVTFGIFISTVPPWTSRSNLVIHDNYVKNTIACLVGALNNSKIYNERYERFWAWGMHIRVSNTLIENNTIVNATLQIPYIWNDTDNYTPINYWKHFWEFTRRHRVSPGEGTDMFAISTPFQRKLWSIGSQLLLFYSNGTHMVYTYTYFDEYGILRWSEPACIRETLEGGSFSVWLSPSYYVHYVYSSGLWSDPIYYRRGRFTGNTINWDTETIAVPGNENKKYINPFISVDDNGYPWIGYTEVVSPPVDTTGIPYVTKSSTNDGTWQTTPGFPFKLSSSLGTWAVQVHPFSLNEVYAVYARGFDTVKGRLWNGSVWLYEEEVSSSKIIDGTYHSVVCVNNVIHLAFLSSNNSIVYLNRTENGWSSEELIQTTVSSTSAPVLGFDDYASELYCFWIGSPETNKIYYKKYREGKWTPFPIRYSDGFKVDEFPITRNDLIACPIKGNIALTFTKNEGQRYKLDVFVSFSTGWSLIVSQVYYRFMFRVRHGILLTEGGDNISICKNSIRYIPTHGGGIGMDVGGTLTNVMIFNNSVYHIADENYAYPCPTTVPSLYKSQEPGGAIELEHVDNITIKMNLMINVAQGITTTFADSIGFRGRIFIQNNSIINASSYAIRFDDFWEAPSTENYTVSIKGNEITNAQVAITVSNYNNILNKTIISTNNIINCEKALWFGRNGPPVRNCTVIENNIVNCTYIVDVNNKASPYDILFYHNNFVNYTYINTRSMEGLYWNLTYPIAGNYWSDYTGEDNYWGPDQNLPGPDGIGDAPYVIDSNNIDYYPLMYPWTPQDIIAITNMWFSEPPHYVGEPLGICVEVKNQGGYNITFSVNINYTTKIMSFPAEGLIGTQNITLIPGESRTILFIWTPQLPGTFNIIAYTSEIPCDITPENNMFKKYIIIYSTPPHPTPSGGGGRCYPI